MRELKKGTFATGAEAVVIRDDDGRPPSRPASSAPALARGASMVESTTEEEEDDEDVDGRRPAKRARAGPGSGPPARAKVSGGRKVTAGQGLAAVGEGVRALSREFATPIRLASTEDTASAVRLAFDVDAGEKGRLSPASFRTFVRQLQRDKKLAATYLTMRDAPAEDRHVIVDMAIEDAAPS